MKIEVKLFATLRCYGPIQQTPFNLDMPAGSRVNHVLETLSIPTEAEKVITINGRPANLDSVLHDGDKLIFFPPVAGG